MASHRRFAPWLLALALLASQWLLATHAAKHWQPQAKADTCQLCFHHAAQDLIAASASQSAAAPIPFVDAAPHAVPAPLARAVHHYRSRAPPAVLA
jgi:hypothetical protein